MLALLPREAFGVPYDPHFQRDPIVPSQGASAGALASFTLGTRLSEMNLFCGVWYGTKGRVSSTCF